MRKNSSVKLVTERVTFCQNYKCEPINRQEGRPLSSHMISWWCMIYHSTCLNSVQVCGYQSSFHVTFATSKIATGNSKGFKIGKMFRVSRFSYITPYGQWFEYNLSKTFTWRDASCSVIPGVGITKKSQEQEPRNCPIISVR